MTMPHPKRRTRRAPVRTVGLRIRKLRRARGMGPLALAGPEFTKRYLRAVERCNLIPSLRVLELFAHRLDVPVQQILRANSAQYTSSGLTSDTELGALHEDLNYQLNYAKMLIKDGKLEEALDSIRLAQTYLESARPHNAKLPPHLLYRIPMLRGMTYLQSYKPDTALPELDKALVFVQGDEEKAATVHNLIGVAYYLKERPELAIREHLIAFHAVQNNVVRDLSSRFSIYRNLANDYVTLGDTKQAVATYKLALPILQDLNDPARKAAIFSGLGIAYADINDTVNAILWSSRALEIYTETGLHLKAAEVSLNLAELLVSEQRFDEAEPFLREAHAILADPRQEGNNLLLCQLNRVRALSALYQGQIGAADEHIQASLTFGKEAAVEASDACAIVAGSYRGTDKKIRPGSACYPIRAYVESLHLAAKIAEIRGNLPTADEMFGRALEWAEKTGSHETIRTITLGYGSTMEMRGALEPAMVYYKAAAQANQPLKRKNAGPAVLVG